MRSIRAASVGSVLAVVAVTTAAMRVAEPPRATAEVRREVIAVYFGTVGTDAQSGMTTAVRDMKAAVARQAASTGRQFVSRGVSLEPSVESGMRHLALLGPFDQVSLGGNWSNSDVVRYLGPTVGDDRRSSIPQVVLVEREVRDEAASFQVGPERELARYVGTAEIGDWVKAGAPIPR